MKPDNIYICHYTKLVDRKNILINHLSSRDIYQYEWVENYNADDWDVGEIKKEYPNIFEITTNGKKLPYSIISLLLKHLWILKDMVKKQYKSVLILEDDVVLCDNFKEKLEIYMNQLPSDWDLGWVGTCCNLHASMNGNTNVYRKNGSRCTHAFVVNLKCAETVLPDLNYPNNAADWYYNYLIEKYNLNNYWFEPPLAIQNKSFKTSLEYN